MAAEGVSAVMNAVLLGGSWRRWTGRDAGFHNLGTALAIRRNHVIDDGLEIRCRPLIVNSVDQDMVLNEIHIDAYDPGDLREFPGNCLMVC